MARGAGGQPPRRSTASTRLAAGARGILVALGLGTAAIMGPPAWRWVTQDARDWAPEEEKSGPSISARGVRLFEARQPDGSKAWEFSVASIELSPDKRWATLSQVSRAVLFREGKPFLQMRAARVRFDQETRDWHAQDDLHVSGPDGLTIASGRADWSEKDQRLNCPEAVSARFKGADIRTVGLVYDANARRIESVQPVSLSAPNITANSTRVVADLKSRVVTFPDGLTDSRIKAPLLEKYGLKR